MIPAATMDEALALARTYRAPPPGQPQEVLIVPHALLTLPVVTPPPGAAG
jgi:hypothetical protein